MWNHKRNFLDEKRNKIIAKIITAKLENKEQKRGIIKKKDLKDKDVFRTTT